MKILVENSGYSLLNLGDLAMLQVAVDRLRALWPEAILHVVTSAPDLLHALVPGTFAEDRFHAGRTQLRQRWSLFGPLHHVFPGRSKSVLAGFEDSLHRMDWRPCRNWAAYRLSRHGVDLSPLRRYEQLMSESDALVATGGGYITDTFSRHALGVTESAFRFARRGRPVAFFGQGLGPFRGGRLWRQTAQTFRAADLISLREGRVGPEILRRMGVEPSKWVVTGDDAIEAAHALCPERLGSRIGFNVRNARYSDVEPDTTGRLFDSVRAFADRMGSEVVPVPISRHEGEELDALPDLFPDPTAARALCEGLDTPAKVIQHVGTCRLVITGSYHAAVFALSQGIPSIGLAKSAYYQDKFQGLADQFGEGCNVVCLDDPAWTGRLATLLEEAWATAEAWRPGLLHTAETQIELGRGAYRRFRDIVEAA